MKWRIELSACLLFPLMVECGEAEVATTNPTDSQDFATTTGPSITTAGTKDNDRIVTGYTVWASGSGFSTWCRINVRKADLTLLATHTSGAAGQICANAHYMRWALTTNERTAIDGGGIIIDVANPDNSWARSRLIQRPGAGGGTVGVVSVGNLVRRYGINQAYTPCGGNYGWMFGDGPITPYSYRDAGGALHVVINAANGDTNYGIAGDGQFGNLQAQCPPSYVAEQRYGDINSFAWAEWAYGFSRNADTGRIYTVIYNEYNGTPPCSQQGDGSPGCEQYMALGLAVKNPGSNHFVKVAAAPGHVIARPSWLWSSSLTKMTGVRSLGTLFHNPVDNYDYVHLAYFPQTNNPGQYTCLMRTNNIGNVASWRAWDGTGFNTPTRPFPAAGCTPVHFTVPPFYLGYSDYFHKYIAVGNFVPPNISSVYYSLSDDMINWTDPVLIMANTNGDIHYPSLADPSFLAATSNDSASSNGIVGETPHVFLIKHTPGGRPMIEIESQPIDFGGATWVNTAVELVAAGRGCADLFCLWITGYNFSENTTVTVRDHNWNIMNTYSGAELSIRLDTSPQALTLRLQTAAERNELASNGLIVTVADHGTWASLRISP